MAPSASSTSSRLTTRAQNASAHPGLKVQGTKRHRRTKAEIEADKKRAEEQKLAKETKKKESLEKVAAIEERLANEDNDVTPRPMQKSRQLRRTSTHAIFPLYDDDNSEPVTEGPAQSDVTYEHYDSDHDGDTDIEDEPASKRPKFYVSKPVRKEDTRSGGSREEEEIVEAAATGVVDKADKGPHGKNKAKSV